MKFADPVRRELSSVQAPVLVDPPLRRNMGLGFKLQVARLLVPRALGYEHGLHRSGGFTPIYGRLPVRKNGRFVGR